MWVLTSARHPGPHPLHPLCDADAGVTSVLKSPTPGMSEAACTVPLRQLSIQGRRLGKQTVACTLLEPSRQSWVDSPVTQTYPSPSPGF